MPDGSVTYEESGPAVRPSADLVIARPELDGATGRVLWDEDGGLAVVRWSGQDKPYRVLRSNLEYVDSRSE